jgi:hypothetical protein
MKYIISERALGKAAVIQGAAWGHYTVKASGQLPGIGWPGKRTTTHLPDVVKILLQKTYYADGRVNPVVA